MEKIRQFLKEAYAELKRVSWPSRQETFRYTMFIVVFSVSLAFFLGFLDYVFTGLLKQVVGG